MTDRHKTALRYWVLVGILLLAFCLRIYRLGAESLWYDETVSVHLAAQSIPELVSHTAGDIHPPGYYLLLHAWTRLAGASEFATAFLSLFFGLLLVSLAYRLADRFFGPDAGLLAALLVAVAPYNLWYSQEVRMYTLGAALGVGLLLTVVSLLAARPGTLPAWSRLAVYALLGALGLWTLYYFAFLLLALNLMIGAWWLIGWRRGRVGWAWLGRWLLAQVAVLLLYAPWLPVAWRQATAPPVPPWRGFTPLSQVLLETWTALSLGQSVDPAQVWPVLLLFAGLFGLGLLAKTHKASKPALGGPDLDVSGEESPPSRWLLAGYVLIPVFLIYLASLITPLYHVRYVFTYSTPFYAILAAGLLWLARRSRVAVWLSLAVILLFSGISIHAYHTDPRYASDDHRAATHFLAERWRPGDAILIDAGYAYTALLTYWDGSSNLDGDPITRRGRLSNDYGSFARQGPVVVQTGTVDGDPSLGWGQPDSDFYAMGRAETADALEHLFAGFDRVWVYRIYDTVTDPDGFIRSWLDEHGVQFEDRVFTGESQLRVQGFLTGRDPLAGADRPGDAGLADGSLQLEAISAWSPVVKVGGQLDLALVWRVVSPPGDDAILFAGLFDQAEAAGSAAATAGSAVDATGPADAQRWAQTDERPLGSLYSPADWPEGAVIRTPLRVSVPPGTPPGRYRLEVGWYRFEDGQPVWLPWTNGERLLLGVVEVVAPQDWSALPLPAVAQPSNVTVGDGVRFLGFDAPTLEGHPGDTLPLDLFWQALEGAPQAGLGVLQLATDAGNVLAEASSVPVEGRVPFTTLAAGQTIRDPRSLTLPGGLEPGVYNLSLGRQRPDGTWLPVRRGPFPLGSTYPLATVRVAGRPLNLTPPAVQHPVGARFGTTIGLVGYDLQLPTSDLQSTTSNLQLTFYWQALASMTSRYKIFVHLVGDGGPADILAQVDFHPRLPTTVWVPGEYLRDAAVLELPDDLLPGRFSLLVGFYDKVTGERLPVFDAAGEPMTDSLLLETIRVGQ